MIVTLHQTQRTFTRVDATRQARTALSIIENELHSACVGANAPDPGRQHRGQPRLRELLRDLGESDAGLAPAHLQRIRRNPGRHQLRRHRRRAGLAYRVPTIPPTRCSPTPPGWRAPRRSFSTTPTPRRAVDAQENTYWVVPDGTNVRTRSPAPWSPPLRLTTSSGLSTDNAGSTVEVVINLSVGATSQSLNAPVSNAAGDDPVTDAISLRLTTPANDLAAELLRV